MFRVGNSARDTDPAAGWAGGFSCVVGNPPWERVKLQEQEFFRRPSARDRQRQECSGTQETDRGPRRER
jgi:hypothetical protein